MMPIIDLHYVHCKKTHLPPKKIATLLEFEESDDETEMIIMVVLLHWV